MSPFLAYSTAYWQTPQMKLDSAKNSWTLDALAKARSAVAKIDLMEKKINYKL